MPTWRSRTGKSKRKLKDAVAELLRRGNHQLLSGMLHALLAYPDYPYDWPAIGYNESGRFVHVTTPPTLDRDTLWPKERKLLEILRQEKAQGRQSWVFACYTNTHPVLQRLEKIIPDAGLHGQGARRRQGAHPASQRMDRREAPGVDVICLAPAAGKDRA